MKGITKGEWKIGRNERIVYSNDPRLIDGKICESPSFYSSMENWEANASLICTAGNLTNAGYNIEAMPKVVEALIKVRNDLKKYWDDNEWNDFDKLTGVDNALKSAKP